MYTERKPDRAVERLVECTWSVEADHAIDAFPVRPDGCMDLLYSPSDGLEVVGTMTVEQHYELAPGEQRAGLRFRPGMARRFLGVGAAELRDRVMPLEDVIGSKARDVESRLESAATPEAWGRILTDAVATAVTRGIGDPVHLAIEAMTVAHGEVDIDEVADRAGMSSRQFRRRCLEESGLGPKHLARVLRFRRACELAARGESWIRIAAEAGYFDQAHLIRDFREFTGATPMSVFSKTVRGACGLNSIHEDYRCSDCRRD